MSKQRTAKVYVEKNNNNNNKITFKNEKYNQGYFKLIT